MSNIAEWNNGLWQNPPSIYRSAPFWAWNERLVPDRLRRQIDQMNQAGMGGFFMHSRYGLKTEYLSEEWFECVSACVEKARSLGMKAYLYDEDRWPSGSAGGIVTRTTPRFGLHFIVLTKGAQLADGMESLGNFSARIDSSGLVHSCQPLEQNQSPKPDETVLCFGAGVAPGIPWFNDGPYLDTMSPEAVAEFIRITHKVYAERFGKDFGGVIPAMFTDEPNFSQGSPRGEGVTGFLPWTPDLLHQFQVRRGYDLREHLPEIFFASADKPFSKVRHDFCRTLTELFVEAFSIQIGQWCVKNNISFTGHYLCEETLSSQLRHIGAAMPHYEYQQWPGIDILCDQIREIGTVKQCTSVAAQMGHPRVLSELYGCTGWDWPLEGHKFNAGWQYVLGVNLRCPHLSWYSMAGGAKRDYPASIFPHSPWWQHYRAVEDYFGRLSLMLTQGRPYRDVLLLHPIESAWGIALHDKGWESTQVLQKPFDVLLRLLLDQHYDYDLGDESIMARHAKVSGARLKVGKMDYAVVVVPPLLTLRSTTVALLKRFMRSGGKVVFVGNPPNMVDGQPSDQMAPLIEQAGRCGTDPQQVVACLENLLPRRVSITEVGDSTRTQAASVWTMLRQVKGSQTGGALAGQMLFVQSVDRTSGHDLLVSVQGRRPAVLWDAATGKCTRLDAQAVGDRVEFRLSLPPTGSALVTLGARVPDAAPVAKPAKVVSSTESKGPWTVELVEPNTLPLDFCRYRIGKGPLSQPVPVLQADADIRKHFGLPPRSNDGHQPWYLAQTGRFDSSLRGPCEMLFTFHATEAPASLHVAIEHPEDFQITFNGKKVSSKPNGWWVDEDIKTVDLASAVQKGENELLLRFDYRSDMELEELHLLGAFGIGVKAAFSHSARSGAGAARKPLPQEAYTLVAPPTQLAAGSWVGQGLDFYGGAVKYIVNLDESIRKAVSSGKRVSVSLPGVKCTAAVIHVGDRIHALPWPPMTADITDSLLALKDRPAESIVVEVIGGRHNIFGPLHVPWRPWTGPGEFDPANKQWTNDYLLNDHGLMAAPVVEVTK